jgi:hypothetical protein
MGTSHCDANGEATSGSTTRARIRMRDARAGQRVVAMKSPIKGWSQDAVSRSLIRRANQQWEEPDE